MWTMTGLSGEERSLLVIPSRPEQLRARLAYFHHGSSPAGHQATPSVVARIQLHYSWPSIESDIKSVVDACDCKLEKAHRRWTLGLPQHLPPHLPFTKLYIDFMGPFSPELSREGKRFVLHVRDHNWSIASLAKP
jgi:hypothetical protein